MATTSEWQVKFFRKSIRFIQLLKHNLYKIVRLKIGDYPHPPKGLKQIGYFDAKMLIHTFKEYRQYFNPDNLSSISRNTQSYKENKISLILDGEDTLIKKKFIGLKKFDDFYSELVCYKKIGHLGFTPAIRFVDYKKNTIYMSYIDGVSLSSRRSGIKVHVKENDELITHHFHKITRLLHRNGIIFNDYIGRNLIMHDNKVYIFDFSDAIYFSCMLLKIYPVKRFFLRLVSAERKRVKKGLNSLGISGN